MDVLYCGDGKMADGLLISVLSLLRTVQEPLHVHILTAHITVGMKEYRPVNDETVELLLQQVQQVDSANTVVKHDVTELFNMEPPLANMDTIFTPNCVLRLFADQVPDLPDRILYLDTDVVSRRDCSEFYHQNMDGIELAGTLDYYGRWFFHNRGIRFDYLNSGVLLLNLKEIRRTGLFERARRLCVTTQMFMPDQSALNRLVTEVRIMPRRYNDQRRLHADTVFQHFTTSFRLWPWVHTLTVKPWQVTAVHDQLKLHEYDDVLDEYDRLEPQLKDKN